jgi:hypothetical protein
MLLNWDGDPSKIRREPDGPDDRARVELAAEALAAFKELDAHGNASIPLQLRLGEVLSNAKAVLKHGEFGPWCLNVLQRSLSWCSAHRRLYEDRADLEPALAWADATEHRWAHCRSVERLLKVVADWRKATQDDGVAAPRTRRKKRAIGELELEEIAARFREILVEAEGAFEIARFELWLTAPDGDPTKEELVALGSDSVRACASSAKVPARCNFQGWPKGCPTT